MMPILRYLHTYSWQWMAYNMFICNYEITAEFSSVQIVRPTGHGHHRFRGAPSSEKHHTLQQCFAGHS